MHRVSRGRKPGVKVGSYLGRRKLLKIIQNRKPGTRSYLLKHLRSEFGVSRVDTKPFRALASAMGLRIQSMKLLVK